MIQRASIFTFAALIAPLLLPGAAAAQAQPQISPESVLTHIRYLASDELRGRGSGTPGGKLAAEYIARQFAKAGVRPARPDGSWFQPFPVITGVHVGSGTRLELQ